MRYLPLAGERALIASGDAPVLAEMESLLGQVQLEDIDGLDVLIARGNARDVAAVRQRIAQMSRSSGRTAYGAGQRFDANGPALSDFNSDLGLLEFPDEPPIEYPDAEVWRQLSERRSREYKAFVAGRQPVLQGGGLSVNRQAGPGGGGFGGMGFGGVATDGRQAGGWVNQSVIFGGNRVTLGTEVYPAADLMMPVDAGGKDGGPARVGLPPLAPQDTGYWNPAIVTGADGKAVLKVTVPERSTSWNLVAKGITQETLAGESTGEMAVKKDLFGQLKLPMAFTDGDEAEVTVSVHNDAIEKGQIEVTLKTTIGSRTTEEKKTIDVKAKGIHDLTFKVALNRPEAEGDRLPRKTSPLPTQPSSSS